VDCDAGHVRAADLATVGAMARACVNARRAGAHARFTNASPALEELIAFVGLEDVLLRPERQVEEREQGVGVEKRVEPDDPAA
jgi:anti-anti-sigma regulatory factor